MEPTLSKQQQAILVRAQRNGGTCRSTTAFAALVDLASAQNESDESPILVQVSNTLASLVELRLMAKSGPGEYHLTEQGFQVAHRLGERFPAV
jgi:predicted transcriptional regulator